MRTKQRFKKVISMNHKKPYRSRRWINWAATIPIRERHRKWFIPVISTNHMRRNRRQVVSRKC